MQGGSGRCALGRGVGLSCMLTLLGGCSTAAVDPAAELRPGLSCVDDSKDCVDRRQGALKGMIADRDRRWVREPAPAHAYASGVRLFAYKGRKKDLTCEELAIGRREAEAGPAVLKAGASAGLSPAQISRGTMLSSEVARELGIEIKRRCRT